MLDVKSQSTYQVALQADELHPGLLVPVGVASENLDELHQVGAELVAALQDAQHRDAVPEVLRDVAGQTLHPAGTSMRQRPVFDVFFFAADERREERLGGGGAVLTEGPRSDGLEPLEEVDVALQLLQLQLQLVAVLHGSLLPLFCQEVVELLLLPPLFFIALLQVLGLLAKRVPNMADNLTDCKKTFFLVYLGTSPEFSRSCLCPFLVSTQVGRGFMGTAVAVLMKSLVVWMPMGGMSVFRGTAAFFPVQV
ncbi:hypothetical protein EYF80_032628 [Liparis tanakae]|uniref:Uncharacterized protein n=1 Tax=Liparis tanakae TaxID=230148 RepID=A0A4Z2GUC4_9TELE|nr:hypothetical protein EYF80_032628 [Liparis tanakae]